MDSDYGGLSSSDRQRQTAAEIARKKVLAAYSSTVDTIKNLPANSRDILLKDHSNDASATNSNSQYDSLYQPAAYQTNWQNTTYQPNTANSAQQYQSYESTPTEQYNQAYYSQNISSNEPSATATSSEQTGVLKDSTVDQEAINAEWAKYHSAWQDYYKNYYSDYYAKAAQSYIATEKMKNERVATGKAHRTRNLRRLIPVSIVIVVILIGLFLQYNRLIFAPIMAYVSPDTGSVATSIEAVDPSITQAVSPEPRLIIPKLNIDVPIEFNAPVASIDEAMNRGVAQFSIPGADAMPGQVGNLVISGHSAGDIYSNNPYKFIFSGLERLGEGDLIYVNYDSVRYTYQMTGRNVVEPTDVASLIYPTDKPILTLITCTPLGTSRYRLLITAEQISPEYAQTDSTDPSVTPNPAPETDTTMPANEPSFFEKIWQGIFGS